MGIIYDSIRSVLIGHATFDRYAGSLAGLIAHQPMPPRGNFYRP
jgi:hypothetical protein